MYGAEKSIIASVGAYCKPFSLAQDSR
jgi:hypothetical protein